VTCRCTQGQLRRLHPRLTKKQQKLECVLKFRAPTPSTSEATHIGKYQPMAVRLWERRPVVRYGVRIAYNDRPFDSQLS
jgi:hypothetical protein